MNIYKNTDKVNTMFLAQALIMENDEITHPGAKDGEKREKFLSVQF